MKRVLFVCTGNTCRSPMAEAFFNHVAKKNKLCFEASSCGIFGDGVTPISENARAALSEYGIECDHISKPVTATDVEKADYIFGVTETHARTLISKFPSFAEKIYLFPTDISDPFGGDIDIYRASLSEIASGVGAIIDRLVELNDE